MPYLADKVLDMLNHILKKGEIDDDDDDGEGKNVEVEEDGVNVIAKMLNQTNLGNVPEGHIMKLKINAVGRMGRMYKNLIENHDILLQIKIANDGRIPRGLLLEGKPAIKNALKEFELAAKLDSENEKRPVRKH